jgi:hypothetical protein
VFLELNDWLEAEGGGGDLRLEDPNEIGGGGFCEVDDYRLRGDRGVCLLTDAFGKGGAGKMLFKRPTFLLSSLGPNSCELLTTLGLILSEG